MSLFKRSNLFLKSFIVLADTTYCGREFHLLTILFEKKILYFDLLVNCLFILYICPLSLSLFVKLKKDWVEDGS